MCDNLIQVIPATFYYRYEIFMRVSLMQKQRLLQIDRDFPVAELLDAEAQERGEIVHRTVTGQGLPEPGDQGIVSRRIDTCRGGSEKRTLHPGGIDQVADPVQDELTRCLQGTSPGQK